MLLIDDHTLETAPEIDQIVSLISVISVINVINVINIFQVQFVVLGPCSRQIRNCLLLMRSAPHLAPHQHTENTESNSFKSVFAFSHSGFFVFKTIFMEFVISILTREILKVCRMDECVKTLISVDKDKFKLFSW